ncbi:MAG TPA: VOC family protein [Puia sp.]|jgi:predicted enzyme related to lactoylglutathione lyase|nr:VOC family protein [Puia sp.]
MNNNSQPTYGNGKICYIELPSRDVKESSDFYQSVFDWQIRRRGDGELAFDDGVGQVSGTWRIDRKPSSEIGMLVHIMIDDIEVTIQKVKDHGGTIIQPVGLDAPEITAHFRDPSGNILGLYQEPSK